MVTITIPVLFVLGGEDLEMYTIKQLLEKAGYKWVQPKTEWGNHLYAQNELGELAPPAENYVFVECSPRGEFSANTTVIDHHGVLADRPASVTQVVRSTWFSTVYTGLSEAERRHLELVAAHDQEYIYGLQRVGATEKEFEEILSAARRVSGVTSEEETEAKSAIEQNLKVVGSVTIVHIPHTRASTIVERLFGQYQALLVISHAGWAGPVSELNFYGDGAICESLRTGIPDSWAGGKGLGTKGGNAYWGIARPLISAELPLFTAQLGLEDDAGFKGGNYLE